MAGADTRLHASFGMGLRPPSGFELAFTDNPALKPERTRSVDAGVEQQFGNLLTLDATYFYNRYYDLIVTLGGSLTTLEPLQIGQSGQLAGAGRGVLGAPAAGPLGAASRDPTRCWRRRILSLDGSTTRRRCRSRWGSN